MRYDVMWCDLCYVCCENVGGSVTTEVELKLMLNSTLKLWIILFVCCVVHQSGISCNSEVCISSFISDLFFNHLWSFCVNDFTLQSCMHLFYCAYILFLSISSNLCIVWGEKTVIAIVHKCTVRAWSDGYMYLDAYFCAPCAVQQCNRPPQTNQPPT